MSTRDDRLQTVLDTARDNPSIMGDAERSSKLFASAYSDVYSKEEASEILQNFSIRAQHPNRDVVEFYAIVTAGAFGTEDLAKAKRFSQFARGRAL